MENFLYDIPTKVYFGEGEIKNLPQAIKEYGSRVLLCYGGGSIKQIGLYDEIIRLCKEHDITVFECAGIEPNPRVTSVNKGAALCREHHIEVVLAVGGGSTIDCAKVIASSVDYEGDAWDIVLDKNKIKSVLPIIAVLTLSATGSEMDHGAVISNLDTNDKIGVGHPGMAPRYAFEDPTYTYSVSPYHTAAGTADIMSHIMECYFQDTPGTFMIDRMAEALLKTCIHYGPIALQEPQNYEARSNLMWASSWAINGLLKYGKTQSWTVHPMEHELSAYYDITHGVGLAILTPNWMNYILSDKTLDKFVEYGVNVWEISTALPKETIAKNAIIKTRAFFNSLGIASTLQEVGIDESNLSLMAKKSSKSLSNAYIPLNHEDVLTIFKNSYK